VNRRYREVAVAEVKDGFAIALDGKPVSTPLDRRVAVPARALAEAIAGEWSAQGDRVRASTMPLMQLAATAIDRIADRPEPVVDELAAYGATDLLCHRVDHPAELARRQALAWQPLLDWCALRFAAPLAVTLGAMPRPQDPAALAALRRAIAGRDAWEMAALGLATHAGGSIVLALAILEGRIDAAEAWTASLVDELYQAERWGEDAQACARRALIRQDLAAAADFLRLLRSA
jgi:chaperone required for assembly of F1-ATPase